MLDINNKKVLGVILVIISTLIFSTSSSLLKLAGESINSFHLMFWRSIIGFVIVLSIGIKRGNIKKKFMELPKKSIKWLIFRAIVGGCTMFCYFTALTLTDIGEVGALHKVAPVFAVIFAFLILKESLNYKVWIAVAFAIAGVMFIRNPFTTEGQFGIPHVLALLAAVGTGFVAICLRKLRLFGLDSWMIVLALLLMGILISLPVVIIDRAVYKPTTYLFLLGAGLLSTLSQLLNTTAVKHIQAKTLSILGLLSVFEFMIIGGVFFNEDIDEFNIIGALLIVIAATITILSSLRKPKVNYY